MTNAVDERKPDGAGASSTKPPSAMSKKIQKIMAIRPDSQNIRDGVSILSDFLGENSANTRRNLRTPFIFIILFFWRFHISIHSLKNRTVSCPPNNPSSKYPVRSPLITPVHGQTGMSPMGKTLDQFLTHDRQFRCGQVPPWSHGANFIFWVCGFGIQPAW